MLDPDTQAFSDACDQFAALFRECLALLNASLAETDYQIWAMHERRIDEAAERLGRRELCIEDSPKPRMLRPAQLE